MRCHSPLHLKLLRQRTGRVQKAEPLVAVFEVSDQLAVPPHGVVAGLEMLELGTSVDFHSLRKSRRAQAAD